MNHFRLVHYRNSRRGGPLERKGLLVRILVIFLITNCTTTTHSHTGSSPSTGLLAIPPHAWYNHLRTFACAGPPSFYLLLMMPNVFPHFLWGSAHSSDSLTIKYTIKPLLVTLYPLSNFIFIYNKYLSSYLLLNRR